MFFEESEPRLNLPSLFEMQSSNSLKFDYKSLEQIQECSNYDKNQQDGKKVHRPTTRSTATKVDEDRGMRNHSDMINTVFLDQVQQLLNLQDKFQHQNILQENTTRQNNSPLQQKTHKQPQFSSIFRPYYANKQQKSNKNFVKFLLPKLYAEFEQRKHNNSDWYLFNKQIEAKCQRSSTITVLRELFQGEEYGDYKRINRGIMGQLLRNRQFYSDYFFSSRYIKRKTNRKQYLLAAKIFSLRCISSDLMGRVQTK